MYRMSMFWTCDLSTWLYKFEWTQTFSDSLLWFLALELINLEFRMTVPRTEVEKQKQAGPRPRKNEFSIISMRHWHEVRTALITITSSWAVEIWIGKFKPVGCYRLHRLQLILATYVWGALRLCPQAWNNHWPQRPAIEILGDRKIKTCWPLHRLSILYGDWSRAMGFQGVWGSQECI